MKILFLTLALLFSYKVYGQVDPSIDWKVIDDPHALWLFDSRHKPLVLQYRRNFKKIFPLLQEMFHEFPEKTTFVISDHTDLPNGSATVFPYPLVTIYPVIPIPTSGIGETNDSFFEILTHEYTHILNLYPVHGSMKLLNYVFGSIVHPNFLLPRWYVEGLAVYSESYFNPKGGRLRSQNFEAMVRAISLGQKWGDYPIDELNDSIPDWVGGQRPYLLGGALMHHIFTNYGDKNIHILNQKFSRRVPFFLNGPTKDITGKKFKELLTDTYTNLDLQAKRQLATITSTQTTEGTSIPEQGFRSYHPKISPDGNVLAFISSEHNVRSGLYLATRSANNDFLSKPKLIDSGDGITHFAWSPDSQFLVYNKINNHERYYRISDLHVYSLRERKSEQVTHGQRVGDMTFGASSNQVYFVQNQTGFKQLSLFNLSTKKISLVYKPENLGTHLFALTSAGDKLLFIEKNNNDQWMRLINGSQQPRTLTSQTPITYLYLKNSHLIFTSNQSGVDNLYIVNNFTLNGQWRAVPLTNSKTRIISGDIDPKTQDLYYSELTPDGLKVLRSTAHQWQQIRKVPTVTALLNIPVPPSYKQSRQEDPTEVPLNSTSDPVVIVSEDAKEQSFYPFKYLIPRYWMPFGYVLDGGMGFTATTTGGDPLLKNSYTLTAEWDTLTEKLGGSASYTNSSTPVSITLGAYDVFRYNRTTSPPSVLEDRGGFLGLQTFIPTFSNNWQWGTEWRYSQTEFTNGDRVRSGPSVFLSYKNVAQRGYEISPESGGAFSLYHQMFLENMGDIDYEKTNLNLQYYFSSWLPKRHVLYTQINGTYAPDLEDVRIFGARPTSYYTSTINGNFVANSLIPPFLMRGYTSGNLLGYNVLSTNLEYRFPIAYIYSGSGTLPAFLRTIHGSFIVDGISLDGFRYSAQRKSYVPAEFGRFYWGGGAELHFDTTIAYYLPIRFTLGVYYGKDTDLNESDFSTFFSFSM